MEHREVWHHEAALRDLVEAIDAEVDRFLADGAYDGHGISACLAAKFGNDIEIIVPRQRTLSLATTLSEIDT